MPSGVCEDEMSFLSPSGHPHSAPVPLHAPSPPVAEAEPVGWGRFPWGSCFSWYTVPYNEALYR